MLPKAQRIAAAGEKFKQHPQFSRIYTQIHEASQKLAKQYPPPLQRGSTESWECATLLFNVHAKAYLAMVDDMPLLDAYVLALESFARQAWKQHTGFPADLATPDDFLYFQQMIGFWKNEAHKKLAGVTQPEQEIPDQAAPTGAAEVERRERLLSEYKAATGNPSNRQIYLAKNSSIHKPEFYAWLNGELSGESSTAINFEAFLRRKKPPTPRTPKP